MNILWLATSSMQLQPIIESLEYAMKVLFTSVSSMNLEPIVSGLEAQIKPANTFTGLSLCRFDKGKEEQHHYEGEVDHVILEAFDKHKPDIVVYSGPAEGRCRPLIGTFHKIRESAKLINLVCDGGCPNWHPLLELYRKEDCFDRTVNIDGNPDWPQKPGDITSVGPIDPRYFEKSQPRMIEFGFAGGLGSLERRQIVDRLKQSCRLEVPERSEAWGTYQNYANFMLGCKSVFNMSKTGSSKAYHCKYRVIESGLAGCVLFEEKNPITAKYFEPGKEYIEYESIDDLEQMIRGEWYKGKYAMFGEALRQRVLRDYSPESFWTRVFNAVGYAMPCQVR